MHKTITISAALSLFAFFTTSAPAITLDAHDIATGNTGPLTFSATGGHLATKAKYGATGVGVSGGMYGGNEIDVEQSIIVQGNFVLGSVTLAYLYDGSEFGDVQESARLTATLAEGGTRTATVTNVYTGPSDRDVELVVGSTSTLIKGTSADNGDPAEITLNDLFGESALSGLTFEAVDGICGTGACNNQSDYAISGISTVPAPASLGLMVLGLALLGGLTSIRKRYRSLG